MSNQEREERALEALIIDTLQRIDSPDVDIDALREPNDKEQAALNLVSEEFIDQLVQGRFANGSEVEVPKNSELAMSGQGNELYRSDGVDEQTAEELNRADQEIIERKKKEQDCETD